MACKVLLPGASTLWRLVAGAREHANERGWRLLTDSLDDAQCARLEGLLVVPAGGRESELERLRHPPVVPTIAGLIAALERLRELRALAAGLGGTAELPVARTRALTGGRPHPPRRRPGPDV